MVVDLTVDSECDGLVRADEWLRASIDTNNAQTLVHKDGASRDNISTPVRSSVSDSFAHAQSGGLEGLDIGMTWVVLVRGFSQVARSWPRHCSLI